MHIRALLRRYVPATPPSGASTATPPFAPLATGSAASSEILYQEWFHCFDLGVQLKPVIDRFFASDECHAGRPSRRYSLSEAPWPIDTATTLVPPFALRPWIDAHARSASSDYCAVIAGAGATVFPSLAAFEYRAVAHTGPHPVWGAEAGSGWGPGELFIYVLDGAATVTPMGAQWELAPVVGAASASGGAAVPASIDGGKRRLVAHTVGLLVPAAAGVDGRARIEFDAGCAVLLVSNRVVVSATAAAATGTGGKA